MNLKEEKFGYHLNPKLRKQLAIFYSKPAISDLLSLLLVKTSNSIILDPACGSGTLLKSAFNKIMSLRRQQNSKSLIIGFEIFHRSWNEAFLLENNKNNKIEIDILYGDAFFLQEELKQLLSQYNKNQTYFNEPIEFIILANPPFSKSQNLPLLYKKEIVKRLNLKHFISLGLHCYFLIFINKILPNKGKFGIILPISISYSNRASQIIKNFLLNSKIEYIIISEAETSFSIDSNFQEIVIIGSKNENENNLSQKVMIINLKAQLSLENIHKIKKLIINSNKNTKNNYFSYYSISQSELIDKIGLEGWNFLYRTENINLFVKDISNSLIPISLEKNIIKRRGLNVPADFFFIPNKYYQINSITESKVHINLKKHIRKNFDKKYEDVFLPKNVLIPLIRKPELYKRKPLIENNENFCLVLDKNSLNDSEISDYLQFGELINANKRSNTVILRENWFLAPQRHSDRGNLFLTFKWDPRYRSFLMNYSQSFENIASQAFWVFKILNQPDEINHFFLSWFNSTLNMVIIYSLADIQRRVWRQLSGNRIDSLLIIPFHFMKSLSIKEIEKCKKYNEKNFDLCLLNELNNALLAIETNNYETNERIQIDLIFLKLLTKGTKERYLQILKELYFELKKELHQINDIN